ncbi:MAG: hypothetical protein A3J51_01635 [Omnitrophica WOR_2 bacterium RIFCSPHIGHO2_02_FULL_45_21]|nr:MAG: hypothetical protein A3J51_01635 [Omnitrophica WOR_2 bacterium RIFCSPHIGHO2_02_FULL_45_21]
MVNHPFKEGTKLAKNFLILSDGKWHCGKHELPGTQPAKAIQIIRQHGFQIENKNQYCSVCQDKTVHRRLVSREPIKPSYLRLQLPARLRRRTLDYYKNNEAITLREMIPNQLEVDHRFPQVRWAKDEIYNPDMPNEEIQKKFQLFTREHNLWKSRYCEHCFRTNERGTFIGINYFYQGNKYWNNTIASDDENGCVGCFWYDPETWRNSLNIDLKK